MLKPFGLFLEENENKSASKRLFGKITKKPNGCWICSGHITKYGYSQTWYKGKAWQSHKLAYVLRKGPVPEGKVILHKCDNRKCVNPAHLKLGTSSDNNNDMAKKGRIRNQHTGPLKGSPRDKGTQESKSKPK